MIRSLSYAAAAATLAATSIAPVASAETETVNIDFTIDAEQITDAQSAEKLLKSLERKAKKACGYEITVVKRKKTDWVCVNDIVEQVVTQIDVPYLTLAYNDSDALIRVADRGDF